MGGSVGASSPTGPLAGAAEWGELPVTFCSQFPLTQLALGAKNKANPEDNIVLVMVSSGGVRKHMIRKHKGLVRLYIVEK